MKIPPTVREEEINKFMDFDALLRKKSKIDSERRKRRRIRDLFIGLACVMVIPGIMVLTPSTKKPPETSQRVVANTSPPAPISAPDSLMREGRLDKGEENEVLKSKAGQEPLVTPLTSTSDELPEDETERAKEPVYVQAEPVEPVYVQAAPIEGYPLLYKYFNDKLMYPAAALKDSVEGQVTVVFVIGPSGKATNVHIENSLGALFDQEAIRLVENMPLWKPAFYNGKPVPSKISLPITFSLKKISNPR